jgi:hypothetical protein
VNNMAKEIRIGLRYRHSVHEVEPGVFEIHDDQMRKTMAMDRDEMKDLRDALTRALKETKR